MKNKKELFLSVLLLVFGSYLLIDKFILTSDPTEKTWRGAKDITIFLEKANAINDIEIKPDETKFILISHNNDCPPCVVEIMEFIERINKKSKGQGIILYVGEYIDKAKKSNKILSPNVPAFFGELKTYQKIFNEERIFNQIIVFDKKGSFVARKYLSKNQISTVEQKDEYLNDF